MQEEQNNSTLILFTGDSITDGLRYKKKSQEWDLNHQMGHSYPYIVNGIWGSMYPEKHFQFKNRGVSGNRIVDLYARIGPDILDLKPDVLSILVGVNDGPIDINCYRATAKEKYEKLFRLLIEEVKESLPDCQIVLMEPFVCCAGKLREEYAIWKKSIRGYAEAVRRIAEEYGLYFIPLQEKFDERCAEGEPEYWCWDGIHPTENGHGLIALEWMKGMKEFFGITGHISK